MLQTQAVLTTLADQLEEDSLDYPLASLAKPKQVEALVSIASRFELSPETIRQRDLQCCAQWTSEEIAAECIRPESTLGELYLDLSLAAPSEMVDLVRRLHQTIEDSDCINWDREELIRLRGEVHLQKIPGFVPTPPELADELIDWLDLENDDILLDPAAGDGAILERAELSHPTFTGFKCCEINADLNRILELLGFNPKCRDYFEWEPSNDQRPNKIVANPPFEGMEDIDFVHKMYRDLAPGGLLATIMSASYSFSAKKKAKEFREWLGTVPKVLCERENDRDAFKPSGCNILSRMLVLQKPE
jgi:hypothetical protein